MRSRIRQKSVANIMPNIFLGGRSGTYIFLIIGFLVFTFGLVRPQAVTGVRIAVTDIFSPVLSIISAPFQNAAETIGDISGVASLQAENAQLKAENIRLREWYQTALMLQAENQSLQKLLNIKLSRNYQYVTARSISDSVNNFVKTILIDAGTQKGVKKNQAVLSGEGMVGRIIETGKNSARILLITDVNSRVPVVIEGSQQKAILSGSNAPHPVLKHLHRDSSVIDGARVITSGDGGVFPAGFPIGRIHKETSGEIVVHPFADLNKLTYVRIVDQPDVNNLIRGSIDIVE